MINLYASSLENQQGILQLSWGSTKGAIVEAMEMLAERGKAIRFIPLNCYTLFLRMK